MGGSCNNSVLCILVMFTVDEIDRKIHGYKQEVNNINDENIGYLPCNKLGGDARKITEDYEKDKLETHGLCGFRLDVLGNRNGPGCAEAD